MHAIKKEIKFTNIDKFILFGGGKLLSSFILKLKSKDDILALSGYGGYEFCSAIYKGKIFGCQFHLEKSAESGLNIIKTFIEII